MLVELKVPVLPESVSEGTLGEWHKNIGDTVVADEIVVDLETDKVVLEIVATGVGVLESIAYETGDTVKNDDVLGVINTETTVAPEANAGESESATTSNMASPSVRKLINESDLEIEDIKAS
ncbi:MAG: dihydrolipoamide succinyltransferase, partial [Gammaproteobacteria bacterium]|nr:dihydrolipoamide succinyltransferase [Gammaproteobacteria bacterium]